MLKVYIVRHGESEANVNKIEYIRKQDHEIMLTEKGHAQATALAGKIFQENDPFTDYNIITSPYFRAESTAINFIKELSEIKKNRSIQPGIETGFTQDGTLNNYTKDIRLIEQSFGKIRTMQERHILLNERRQSSKFFYRFNNGESGWDVAIRTKPFVDELLKKTGVYVVFTHGITAQMIYMNMTGASYEAYDNNNIQRLANCGYFVYTHDNLGLDPMIKFDKLADEMYN